MPFVGTVSGGSSIAAGDITDIGATGEALVTAVSESSARAAIDAAQTDTDTPSLASSSGWTITPMAAGSGAITGGAFTSTIPEGTTTGTGAYATRAWPYADGVAWEVQGRVQITSDTNAALLAGLRVAWTAGNYTVYLLGSGGLYLYRDGPPWSFATQTISGSGLPLDGTLWFRMRGTGISLRVWWGIGSGSTAPTMWTCASDITDTSFLASRGVPETIGLFGFSNDTHTVPAGTTVVWRDIRVRSFDP